MLQNISAAGLLGLRNMLPCMYCLRLLDVEEFGKTRRQNDRRLKGRSFYVLPYCAGCGFAQKPEYLQGYGTRRQGYRPGSEAYVDGVRWVRC